ncbi:hypothetical protein [Burkholderia ubonensis]|uniref:hypothetical protein n=1 Tax=Burkholderia ubonensis TaxID=101571 RepID=UPI000B182D60|nr:hypothetical protein [Burkholderia ubonensis]
MSSGNFVGSSVGNLLEDSERMLTYAARAGKMIEPDIPATIAVVREALACGKLTARLEGQLYCAQSRLAGAIKPVSAETLDPKSTEDAKKATRRYFVLTSILAVLIVPASMVMFVDSKLSESGKALVEANDKIAIPLHEALQTQRSLIVSIEKRRGAYDADRLWVRGGKPDQDASASQRMVSVADERREIDYEQALTPSALAIKEQLQVFARNNRQLYAETRWLELLSLHGRENPYGSPWMRDKATQRENLELTLPMLVRHQHSRDGGKDDQKPQGPEHSIDDGLQKLAVYQDIRAMAQNAQHTSDFLWSAIAVYLLPVLYAVLGTLAFILRDLCTRTRNQTYHASHAQCAYCTRMIVAVIVGTVIGLFDKFMDGSISASPLAIAFVAGYAVDPFFAFIDHVASVGRTRA